MEDHQLQILLEEMKKQTKYQKRIMNNVIFWFWLTMTVPLIYLFVFVLLGFSSII